METVKLHNIQQQVSRIGLGTWAIGGWMWGGTDEKQSIQTILQAFDKGINLVDTAPVYGFGTSEKIVGKALKEYGKREDIVLVTKVGLDWEDDRVFRNSSRQRLQQEIDLSLQRLQTDYIDVYMIHWPDSLESFEETAQTMESFKQQGKIRSIAVSNYSPEQMNSFQTGGQLDLCEPPYNLFERGIEDDILPYCQDQDIKTLVYGSICRGLLSGKMSADRVFQGDDLRKTDPKFQGERFQQYLAAVDELDAFAKDNYGKGVIHLAVRWVLDKGADIALWGARNPQQLDAIDEMIAWKLDSDAMKQIDEIIKKHVKRPVGPEFMAPPKRKL